MKKITKLVIAVIVLVVLVVLSSCATNHKVALLIFIKVFSAAGCHRAIFPKKEKR